MKNKKLLAIFLISVISVSSLTFLIPNKITPDNVRKSSTEFEPEPEAPNENFTWAIDRGNIFGWTTELYINGSCSMIRDSFYNISDIGYEFVSTFSLEFYMVKMAILGWNSSDNSFQETQYRYNASLINISNNMMIPSEGGSNIGSPPFFIPKNGSSPAVEWCGNALNNTFPNSSYYVDQTLISFNYSLYNPSIGLVNYSITSVYDNEGILERGEISTDGVSLGMEGKINIIYKKISDLNPFNEIGDWAKREDDIVHFETHKGTEVNKTKIEINNIENTTILQSPFSGLCFCKAIWGNISIWNDSSNSYVNVASDTLLGAADEHYPVSLGAMMGDNNLNYHFMYPQGATGNDIIKILRVLSNLQYPELNITSGYNWFKLKNSTSGGYSYAEILPNGIIKYSQTFGDVFSFTNQGKTNITFFNSDYYSYSPRIISDYDTIVNPNNVKTTISFNISVNKPSLLLFSEENTNPTFSSPENTEVFFDVTVNESTSIDNVKITFCNPKYSESGALINVWWYNNTANGGNGAWQEIQYTDLGGGNIRITTDHLSIFALTYEEAAEPEPTNEIPGYPSLVLGSVILMGIIGVITVYRKKQ